MTEWFEIRDIVGIGIACHKCSGLVTYALPAPDGKGSRIPFTCPQCQEPLLDERAWDWESVNELVMDISAVLDRHRNLRFERNVK